MTPLIQVLFESSLRICAVAAVVAVFLAVSRARSSSFRHASWTAVLLAMLLMPLLPRFVPPLRVPAAVGAAAIDILPTAAETPGLPIRDIGPVAPAPVTLNWRDAIASLYAAIVFLMLFRLARGWNLARRLVRATKPIPSEGAAIYESGAIAMPVTTGVWRPRVLLPSDWSSWPKEKLAAVVAHEMAHVKRRDTATALFAKLNRCIFWFHALAWWLDRHLAAEAECACDDAGVAAIGEGRKYAQVLLEIAQTVQAHGRGMSWQGIGFDGTGLLGARIERVLRGGAIKGKVTRGQKWVAAIVFIGAIAVAAACRNSLDRAPLRPDPQETARAEKRAAALSDDVFARNLKPEQVAELEAAVKKNPEDLKSREKLMSFYVSGGHDQTAFVRHQIWMVEHHPEERTSWQFANTVDAESLARMNALWKKAVDKPDATPIVLARAAEFYEFESHDLRSAENVVLRLPSSPNLPSPRVRLGQLYATAIARQTVDPEFAAEVQKKLEQSSDPVVLAATGCALVQGRGRYMGEIAPDAIRTGKIYLERALKTDLPSSQAQQCIDIAADTELHQRMRQALGTGSAHERYAALQRLSRTEQFHYLPSLVEVAYAQGENLEFQHKSEEGKRLIKVARSGAEQLLQMSVEFRNEPNYGNAVHTANMALGMAAMRLEGDKKAADRYLLAAANVPQVQRVDYFFYRLPVALLRYGGPDERAAVIQYCDRYSNALRRSDVELKASADQLRHGVMPPWYQYAAPKLR